MPRDSLKEILEIDRDLIDSNRDLHDNMRLFRRYTTHEQWPEDLKRKLEQEKRPALEIDITLPKVNTWSGIERGFRSGIRAMAQEGRDDNVASILTALLVWSGRNRRLDRTGSRIFKDAGIDGLGWWHQRVRMGEDYVGEIIDERVSALFMRFSRETTESDLSDTVFLERDQWMTFDQIEKLWPNVDLAPINSTHTPTEVETMLAFETEDYVAATSINFANFVDTKRRKRRVVELFERKFIMRDAIYLPQTGEIFNVDDMFSSPTLRSIWRLIATRNGSTPRVVSINDMFELIREANLEGFEAQTIRRPDTEIWSATFSAGTILNQPKRYPAKHNQFPYIPAWGYIYENEWGQVRPVGIVEGLMGLQDEMNKLRSVSMDLLARAPKGGGTYNKNHGLTQAKMDAYNEPGTWIGVNGPPAEIIQERSQRQLPILQHYQNFEGMTQKNANDASGISDPLRGIAANSRESGRAAQTRISQSMQGLAEPLENFEDSRTWVASQRISNMQQYWTPDKIRRIINEEELGLEPGAVERFLEDFGIAKYDVTIDRMDNSPTAKAWMRSELIELVQFAGPIAGAALLPAIIDLGDFPNKDGIIQAITEATQIQQLQATTGNSGAPA